MIPPQAGTHKEDDYLPKTIHELHEYFSLAKNQNSYNSMIKIRCYMTINLTQKGMIM